MVPFFPDCPHSFFRRLAQDWGYWRQKAIPRVCSLTPEWPCELDFEVGEDRRRRRGAGQDVMEIDRPGDLRDIAALGLTLSEAKQLLAVLQREIVAAQVRDHAARRPDLLRCGRGVRHVKDYREHVIATLFGQVMVRLPRFRCAACGGIEVGIDWPSYCRSTPELSPASGASLRPDDLQNGR